MERFGNLEPKGALLKIPHFHWKSIYTVNIDTLLEQAYTCVGDRVQELRPFYSDKDSLSRLRPNEVPLYKLHGCISRANAADGRLVMTQEDFVRVQEARQRLFNRLVEDVSDYTILYGGFRRHDADFTRALVDVERAAGNLTDLRRSYALQPNFTEPEERRWEQKRVTLINATADAFFTELEALLPEEQRFVVPSQIRKAEDPPLLRRKPAISAEVLVDVERNFEIIDERIDQQEPNTSDFFLGAQPNWATMASRADAPRDLQDSVLDSVLQDPHLDRVGVQLVLLHSEAGTGKTTLLKRLAVELSLTWNKVVVALRPYGELDFLALERLATSAKERVYVIVDDASGMARELSDMLNSARQAKIKLTVLAAARTNEWSEVRQDYSLPVAEDFELGRLSRREVEAVIAALTKHNALGLLSGTSYETKIAAFESRADKQLLVALREATEGKSFDQIVVDEYDRIPSPDGQRAYLLVAALHRLGIYTRAGLLQRALGIPLSTFKDRVFGPTTKVIVQRDVLRASDVYYSTRHRLIAELVFDRKLASERRRLEYYSDLIKHLDLGYSSDADTYRKLTRGKNKQLLRDFDDSRSRRDLMQQLIKVDPSDAFTYQHAAMMELEERNIEEASKHISKAIELRPDDPAIRDTEGRLALLLAVAEPDPIIANDKFARAEHIFQRNIQRRRDEPFGYRHLAETYVAWAEKQGDNDKRFRYMGLAYQTLLNGLDKCSSASMLLQYQGELEERLGNSEGARAAFARVLKERPSDIVTRFMAAQLEERDNRPTRALELLEEGLEVSSQHSELHYRIAVLKAVIQPERDAEIRSHFEAALLGPLRNYRPRLYYAAYLFSQKDFRKSEEQFSQLDNLLVTNEERYQVRKIRFGPLTERHAGRIRRLSYHSGFVEYAQGAIEIFFSMRQVPQSIARDLYVGRTISFEIRFNLKGPVAAAIQLVD